MSPSKKVQWTKLDNVSKIFPSTANNRDPKVYRLSCELFECVNPVTLQAALDLTIDSFPIYRSVLRRGVFWYYFDESDLEPVVSRESKLLCAPLYFKNSRNLLFRVIYYNKRINVEIFHALTDGAGAIWFAETLIFHYLMLTYQEELQETIPKLDYKASISQKMSDSFEKTYYKKKEGLSKKSKEKKPFAYQIKESRLDENRTKLIEGAMSLESTLALSRKYNTSLTVFLTALLLYSISSEMPEKKKVKPVVISVPINLRQLYQSFTARNFFTTMNINYNFSEQSSDFTDIIESVDQSFKDNLTKESLDNKMAQFMDLQSNPFARISPLPLKDLSLKVGNAWNNCRLTSSLSNLGRISTAPEFEKYIRQFSICVNARRPQITLCSYKDRLVISFTSPYEETDIQQSFFQFLANQGIVIDLASNL